MSRVTGHVDVDEIDQLSRVTVKLAVTQNKPQFRVIVAFGRSNRSHPRPNNSKWYGKEREREKERDNLPYI